MTRLLTPWQMRGPRLFWTRLETRSCALMLTLFLAMLTSYGHAAPIESQVVRLQISKKAIDESAPWQFEDVEEQTHLGVVLRGDRILTTAYAVNHAGYIEMQKFGSSERHELILEFADFEINLAILRPKAPVGGLSPVTFGGELRLDDKVDIYRARDTDQLIKMPATLQDVGILSAVTSTYSALSYQLKIQQTGLGWSEPVFQEGKLVALCSGQDSQFVHAVPAPVIEHLLKDTLGPHYRGFPTAGLGLSPLVSPEMRQRLAIPFSGKGIRVSDVIPGSPFYGSLKIDDVILEINGTPINDQGYFNHPQWGKVPLKYLLNQRYAGDPLRLKGLRQGVPIDVTRPLVRYDSNSAPVLAYRTSPKIPHLIFGGLIFQELSVDFLRQWGKDWRDIAPIHLLYTLEYENRPREKSDERIIFLTRVLADPMNRGYGDLTRLMVAKVNGMEIHTMDDLRQAFANPVAVRGKQYAQIQLARGGGEVILAYEDLAAGHKRMAKMYEIPSTASFFDPAP